MQQQEVLHRAPPDSESMIPEQIYREIANLAYARFGLDLRHGKRELVSSRLSRKVKETNCGSYQEYFDLVKADETGQYFFSMIDALTTNHTAFLRERAHFDFLAKQAQALLANRDKLCVWSAASATGEEVYTILMVLIEALHLPFPDVQTGGRVQVKGTDISRKALTSAKAGIYTQDKLLPLPNDWKSKYFLRGRGRAEGMAQVKPQLKQMATFEVFNLVSPNSGANKYPVIFCRNVMIYFDKENQERVIASLVDSLEPGGFLIIGHAENISGMTDSLTRIAPAVYQKTGDFNSPNHSSRSSGPIHRRPVNRQMP